VVTHENTPCGTRTHNLRIRSPTPCPLGQGGLDWCNLRASPSCKGGGSNPTAVILWVLVHALRLGAMPQKAADMVPGMFEVFEFLVEMERSAPPRPTCVLCVLLCVSFLCSARFGLCSLCSALATVSFPASLCSVLGRLVSMFSFLAVSAPFSSCLLCCAFFSFPLRSFLCIVLAHPLLPFPCSVFPSLLPQFHTCSFLVRFLSL
jgi:hypothetical protein